MAPTALTRLTYLLVDVVARKLHSRVGHYAYTIGTISSHKSSPPFISPHLCETLPNRQLVFRSSSALYLEQNLEAFEW